MAGGRPLLRTPDTLGRRLFVDRPDGATIAVGAYGRHDGDVVVLVHGFAVNAKYWYPQINGLADTHRVIVYDQRGHGRSTLGAGPTTSDDLGHDLEAVLAATLEEGDKAVIVGHSMGGMTVMSWAAQYSGSAERYANAIMLAGTACTAPVTKAPIRLAEPATILRRIEYETAWLGFNAIHRPGGDLMMRSGLSVARTLFPGISRRQLRMLDSFFGRPVGAQGKKWAARWRIWMWHRAWTTCPSLLPSSSVTATDSRHRGSPTPSSRDCVPPVRWSAMKSGVAQLIF